MVGHGRVVAGIDGRLTPRARIEFGYPHGRTGIRGAIWWHVAQSPRGAAVPSTLHVRATMALGAALGVALWLIALLGPAFPAQAQDSPLRDPEATAADFWRAAAQEASVSVYAPTASGLRRAGVAPLYAPMGNLQMVCRGEWNVNAGYDARAGDGTVTISQGAAGCLPDAGVDVTVAPNPSRVGVAGGSLQISYAGCRADRTPDQPGTAEAACPVEQRLYGAAGRLPAVGGRKATHISVDAAGLSRAQITGLLRSLRPVQ